MLSFINSESFEYFSRQSTLLDLIHVFDYWLHFAVFIY